MIKYITILYLLIVLVFVVTNSEAQQMVDVEISLVVDNSVSVTDQRLSAQREVLRHALHSPRVIKAIHSNFHSTIAIQLIEFNDDAVVTIPWTSVSSTAELLEFTNKFREGSVRIPGNKTNLGTGVRRALMEISNNSYISKRQVVIAMADGVSTDSQIAASLATLYKQMGPQLVVNGVYIPSDDSDSYMMVNGFSNTNNLLDLQHHFKTYIVHGYKAKNVLFSDLAVEDLLVRSVEIELY